MVTLKTIVCPVDLSELSIHALAWAASPSGTGAS
jgi:hypothetical protein